MPRRILLVGASSATGKRLASLLSHAGHYVVGTTRSEVRAEALRYGCADLMVVDVFDNKALSRAVATARPEVVIHTMTDLSTVRTPQRIDEAIVRAVRMREEGTQNLVRSAIAAGARKFVAQSIAWAYADGPKPHSEDDPLDIKTAGITMTPVSGVLALEHWALRSPPLSGAVLRYGRLYGPGTGTDVPNGRPCLHVDAAAYATLLAVEDDKIGIFNIAEANDLVATDRARTELGWVPNFRLRNSVKG